MKMLKMKEVASVKLFEVEISEDELNVYERCIKYISENFTADKIEEILGAYDDELQGMREDILNLLANYTDLRSKIVQ